MVLYQAECRNLDLYFKNILTVHTVRLRLEIVALEENKNFPRLCIQRILIPKLTYNLSVLDTQKLRKLPAHDKYKNLLARMHEKFSCKTRTSTKLLRPV